MQVVVVLLGKVLFSAPLVDVQSNHPGNWRNSAVPGPLRLVRTAIVAVVVLLVCDLAGGLINFKCVVYGLDRNIASDWIEL